MAEMGHYYPWASPSYVLDRMSLEQWHIYRSFIPVEYRLELKNPREPDHLVGAEMKDGKRIIRK